MASHGSSRRRYDAWGLAGYDTAAALAASAPVLVFLLDFLWAHAPAIGQLLNGRDTIDAHAGSTPNYIRNAFELTSFIATTAIVVTAAAALYFTLDQIGEARDARVASIYIEINNKYNSPSLTEARRAVKRLADRFAADPEGEATFGDYVARHFGPWSRMALETPDFMIYNEAMRLMQFWEDVGVLIRRTLADIDVVLDFHAGAVRYAESVFGAHVIALRAAHQSRTLYANALWLMDQARDFEPFAYP